MNHSRLILFLGCTGAILGTAGLLLYTARTHSPVQELILDSDAARRSFLSECGRNAAETPPVQSELTLPEGGTSDIYEAYCALQDTQQLPLLDHAGQKAVRWTYTLSQDPSYRAELICTPEGLLLGAMYYDCTRFDRMYPILT
ncbi:MAG: DUF4830 domain-containing protein [Ruminococcus sp.]|nr:DUF4830 domain-containing protein [Ruminococcus sp.]